MSPTSIQTISDLIKQYTRSTDNMKLDILIQLSTHPKKAEAEDFLIELIKTEHYDQIRIKTILILKEFETDNVQKQLRDFYSFERLESVRLAIVEALGKLPSPENNSVLITAATNDKSQTIRSAALRNLHDKWKIDEIDMKTFLMKIIKTENAIYPKQMALSLIPFYAEDDTIEELLQIFETETMERMKQLVLQTLHKVADKLMLDIDLPKFSEDTKKPLTKIERSPLFGNLRKKKSKKKKKDDYLYF